MLPAILPDTTAILIRPRGHEAFTSHSSLSIYQKTEQLLFPDFPSSELYLLLPCKAERSRRYTQSKYRELTGLRETLFCKIIQDKRPHRQSKETTPELTTAGFHSVYSLEPQEYSSLEEHIKSDIVKMPLELFCEARNGKAKKAAVARWVGLSFQNS